MAKNKIAIAKLTRPAVRGIYPRKRLFKLLDSGRKRPITWIAGPAGSGKTSLVASYLDVRKLPCLWFQIDEGDTDIASFFYYMGLAAQQAVPRHRKHLPFLTPEYLLGLTTFSRRYFEALYARLKPPFVIVFDNYQKIPDDSPFHGLIQQALSALPAGISAVIVSRREAPPAMAGLIAGDRVEIIRAEALRLSFEENREIVKLQSRIRPSRETIEYLHQKTEGWAAGLILLLKANSFSRETPDIGRLSNQEISNQEIFDYFAGEVFDSLDSGTRDFLLMTSFLPRMTSDTAGKLSEHDNADNILSNLNRNHFFTEKHQRVQTSYQYHPLFREFLQTRMKKSLSADGMLMIQKRAAELLLEANQIEDAAGLFISTGDQSELVKLIIPNALPLIIQGRHQVLLHWIDNLPKTLIENTPYLLFWRACCIMPFQPGESRKAFQKAFALLRQSGDRALMFLAWSNASDMSLIEANDFSYLDDQIALLNDVLAEDPSYPSPDVQERVTMSMFNALSLRQPWNAREDGWEERAFELVQKGHDKNLRMYTGVCLVVYHFYMGNMAKAGRAVMLLREELRTGDVTPLNAITVKTAEAMYLYMADTSERSVSTALDVLRISEESGVHIWDNHILGHACAAALSLGDLALADDFLARMAATRHVARRFDIAYYHALSAWRALLSGEPDRALEHINPILEIMGPIGFSLGNAMAYILTADVHLARRDYEQASHYLTMGKDLAMRIGSKLFECSSLLLGARMAFQRADSTAGLDKQALLEHAHASLRTGLWISKQQGIKNMFGWRSDVMAKLFARALSLDIEVDHVVDLIRIRKLVPETPPIDVQEWPWPLRIYTLGRFEIHVADKQVKFTGKVQQKPLALLKALISFGGKDVREDRLNDLLWPEAEGDASHSAFSTTLQRLRVLTGSDKAIQLQEGRLSLDPRYCWTDAWAFERLIDKAERAWEGTDQASDAADPLHLTGKAVSLYKGLFLPGDTHQAWTVSYRERLRSKFLRITVKAGGHYEQAQQWGRAVDFYERALEVDDLAEEIYQRLMICQQKLGRIAEAIKAYQRCRSALSAAMDIAPSQQTEAVYKSLR